jgi:AcrR family transcriptional regulator
MARTKYTRAETEERITAAHAKYLMQHRGLSLRAAAHEAKVPPAAILRWFPGTVIKDDHGRYVALPDREVFRMQFVAKGFGLVEADVRGSHKRILVGRQGTAIHQLLDPRIGDDRWLRALRGGRVAGLELETDPDVIEDLYRAGMLDFVVIYVEDI